MKRREAARVWLAALALAVMVTGCAPAPAASTTAAPAAGVTASAKPQGMPTPTMQAKKPTKEEEIQKIKPEELKALIDGKADLVVVDNQPKGAYDQGHVPGAINFPWAMEITDVSGLPKDKLLVLYCACQHEEDSTFVAMQLITKFGFEKVMLLDGGWNRWVELNLPVEKGK